MIQNLKIASLLSLFILIGCAQTPVVVPEIIRQPVYIPIPATLVQPVQVTLLPGITYGEALGRLNAGLQTCNADKAAIRTLTPPKPPK